MEIINREEICSACLEYQSQVVQISDNYIKQVYKSFANDYQNDEKLYLCYYCRHRFNKISKFKTMCLRSYLFLTKNLHFPMSELAKTRTSIENCTDLGLSKVTHVYLPFDDDFINIDKLKKEKIEETKIAKIKEEIIDEANNYTDFKEETNESTTEENSNDVDGLELPIEFDNKTIEYPKQKKLTKVKTSDEIKKSQDSANIKNMTRIKLSLDEQIKELDEKRQSEKYLKALYKCEDCAQTFELGISLEKHLKKHDQSQGSHECWLCHLKFSSKKNLGVHTLLHSTKLVCKLCNHISTNYKAMKDHIESHSGETHPCHFCGKVFSCRNALSIHLKIHKTDETKKKFKCQQCDKTFCSKFILNQHEFSHTNIRPYSCETCGKCFKLLNTLNAHKRTHNEKTGEHYCVECDVSFKTRSELKCHLENTLKHTDPALLKFGCGQCPKKFKSQEKLDSHIKSLHDKIPKYSCDICGGLYVTKQGLRIHKRKAHEGFVSPRKYGCPTCDKQFSSKQVLDNHVLTHTGERPFKCDLCDWTFRQKSALMTHIKLKHFKLKLNALTKKPKRLNT